MLWKSNLFRDRCWCKSKASSGKEDLQKHSVGGIRLEMPFLRSFVNQHHRSNQSFVKMIMASCGGWGPRFASRLGPPRGRGGRGPRHRNPRSRGTRDQARVPSVPRGARTDTFLTPCNDLTVSLNPNNFKSWSHQTWMQRAGMRQERVLGGWRPGLAWGWWLRGRGPGGNLGP